MPSSRDRLERNAESRAGAVHNAEPWTEGETELLIGLWDRREDSLDIVAEALGRTREACRERFYKVMRNACRHGDKPQERPRPAWLADEDQGGSPWYV